MISLLVLFTVALNLTAAQTAPTPTASLLGTQWELQQIGSKAVSAERKPTLNFAEGRAGGHLGCNTGGGSYTLKNSSLQFGPILSTMMACDDPLMKLERDYSSALQKTLRFTLSEDGKTLRLLGTGNVLTFKRL